MQTTVENMMVAQAEESMAKFLAWAKKHCLEVKQKQVGFRFTSVMLLRFMAGFCTVAMCSSSGSYFAVCGSLLHCNDV